MQLFAINLLATHACRRPASSHSHKVRLIIFILLAIGSFIFQPANAQAQTVSLNVKNATLQVVIKEVIRQTGVSIIYNEALISKQPNVTLRVKNATIQDVLRECLKGSSLSYEMANNAVVIKKKSTEKNIESSFSSNEKLNADGSKIMLRGGVSDSLGNPLEQASIRVGNSQNGRRYVTKANGQYEIDNIQVGDTLFVSYIGYVDKTVVYTGNNYLYIRLSASQNSLDETVVQAYGKTSRRFTVGDIATITADDISKQPVSNVALALQGRIPGLMVTPRGGGIPGATVQLQVRGQNGLAPTASTTIYDQPLILVDGIPTAMQNKTPTQLLNSFVSGTGLSPINGLNPSDIASISVLKDADATSIYGSQGANGVIIITTKRGKAGKTQLNINVNMGPNSPTTNLQMLNTQQYLQLRNQAVQLDGINLATASSGVRSQFTDLLNFDTTKYTDFVKEFFNRNPMNTDVHVGLSGGSGLDSYILSGGYTRSAYNLPGNFADNRLSFHSGAHHTSMNRKFNLDFGTDFSYDKNNASISVTPAQAMALPPDYPDFFTSTGALAWNYNGAPINQLFAAMKQPYNIQQFSLATSIKLDYELITGLKATVLAGYNRADNREYSAAPKSSMDPSGLYNVSSANFSSSLTQTINIEPQLNYRTYIGNGSLTALVGGTYKKNFSTSNRQTGTDYPDDALLNTIQAAKTVTFTDNSSIYKYVGAFARLNYIYENRYIANLTARRDGSSNFGPSHQFGNFGSVGLGWIFSEENGFKKILPFISFGKLSANYGTNGTDGVGAYMYQAFYKLYNSPAQPTFQGTVPFIPNNLYNPDYTWASKHSLNIHMDLGFLKDRILLGTSWYQNRTGNQLTSYPLPSLTGFTSVVQNMNANLQNSGIEFTLTTRNVKNKDFGWTTTFNISANRNKLLSFPGLATSSYASSYKVGQSTTAMYGFKFAGINDTTGVFQFYKGDGKTKVSSGLSYIRDYLGGDMVYLGNTEPSYFGGLGNDFSYKGFSLSLFFQFSSSLAKNYISSIYSNGGGPGYASNYPDFILGKIWSGLGDQDAVFQRPTTGNGTTVNAQNASRTTSYIGQSTYSYSTDRYIRLKTLSISYQFPTKIVKALGMSNFSVYLNAQNVFTITNYKFGDPEMPGQLYGIPTQRILAGGLNITF